MNPLDHIIERTTSRGTWALLSLGLLLASLLPAGAVAASGTATADRDVDGHEQIQRAVHRHLAAYFDAPDAPRAEIEVNRLDPRLRIDACPRPLQTSSRNQQRPAGRVSVRVECTEPSLQWARYVQATVQVFESVVVATRTLRRGERLQARDIELREIDTARLRDTVYRHPERAEGMAVRRTIAAGNPLTAGSVTEPILIERGDTVSITAESGTVRIRHQGVALQDGVMGERIRIRNQRSERVIQATVTDDGEARVAF